MSDSDTFDFTVVHQHFQNSLKHEEEDIDLECYLASYEELNKFFSLLGTLFGFVSADLKSKVEILADLSKKEEENFKSVKKMIIYEKENKLLTKSGYVSGSRTLLRLHRGLDFIRVFLQYVAELNDDDHTGHVCRKAYDETLAHHHSFVIRAAAKSAMYTMPKKDDLFKKVCKNDKELQQQALEILPQTLEVMSLVFEITEKVYSEHDLHKLP